MCTRKRAVDQLKIIQLQVVELTALPPSTSQRIGVGVVESRWRMRNYFNNYVAISASAQNNMYVFLYLVGNKGKNKCFDNEKLLIYWLSC